MGRLNETTAEVFRARPQGGFQSGRNWTYFCLDEELFGFSVWGRPEPADIEALVRLLELELDRPLHQAVVDFGGLGSVTQATFKTMAQLIRDLTSVGS